MTVCYICYNEFSLKRFELGYKTCLDCGEEQANVEIQRKTKCSAPAYNKGAYMYVTSRKMAKDVGK